MTYKIQPQFSHFMLERKYLITKAARVGNLQEVLVLRECRFHSVESIKPQPPAINISMEWYGVKDILLLINVNKTIARISLVLTNNLFEEMDPSFCKASFKSPLPLMAGSLCTPSAAAKIVIWHFGKHVMSEEEKIRTSLTYFSLFIMRDGRKLRANYVYLLHAYYRILSFPFPLNNFTGIKHSFTSQKQQNPETFLTSLFAINRDCQKLNLWKKITI